MARGDAAGGPVPPQLGPGAGKVTSDNTLGQTGVDGLAADLAPATGTEHLTADEVWQVLLGCCVQECDHRCDISRHCQLLRRADVGTLVPLARLEAALRKELRSGMRVVEGVAGEQKDRDIATVGPELAAYTGSPGPYTLAEIYSCFSFGDKLSAIRLRADLALLAAVRAPGAGLMARLAGDDSTDLHDIWAQRLPEPKLPPVGPGGGAAVVPAGGGAAWRPPSPAALRRLLRAGASPLCTDSSGQTPLHVLCESAAAVLADSGVWEGLPMLLDAVRLLAAEGPMALLVEDRAGNVPLCILGWCKEDLAPGVRAAHRELLQVLCHGFGACFATCPEQVLHVARHCHNFREVTTEVAAGLGADAPAPLRRILEWVEVAMGGAWEVALDEWRHSQCAALEGLSPGVEEMVESAIRLTRLTDEVERRADEWRAEEASLRLRAFEAACAGKARQYEERIARLEQEIERRARAAEEPDWGPGPDGEVATAQPQGREVVGQDSLPTVQALAAGAADAGSASWAPRTREEARAVVAAIRRDRLVDCDTAAAPEHVRQGLASMRRSLCAAVERLATDLYAGQCHCLWELVQNADDNPYAPEVAMPWLEVSLNMDPQVGAYLLTVNNEVGLSTKDVMAICDVNASLKGAGQTGHKGIGWKSVFRVSDSPHVLSGSFAFKFDVAGPLGRLAYVTPTALSDEEIDALPLPVRQALSSGHTVMYLPLRSAADAPAAEAEMQQVARQRLCLALLRRLRRLTLRFADGSVTRLERAPADYARLYFESGAVAAVRELTLDSGGRETGRRVAEYVLHSHAVPLPGAPGGAPAVGELLLAFPAGAAEGHAAAMELPLQPLFTFLPVRLVGFRFAIQGPFDLTADRGNLHGKSAKNRALCAAIPRAFVGAMEAFPQLRGSALALLGQETPEAAWLAVRSRLLDALKDVACVPTEPSGELAAPRDCLLPPEAPRAAEAAQLLPPGLLWERCGKRVVLADWALRSRVQLRRLGVEELGLAEWLAVLRELGPAPGCDALPQTPGTDCQGLAQTAARRGDIAFFRRLLAFLGELLAAGGPAAPEPLLEQLRGVPLLPSGAGRVLRLADGPIFESFAPELPEPWQRSLEAVGAFHVLDPRVAATLDGPARAFPQLAGVSKPNCTDVVALAAEWHLHVSSRAEEATVAAEVARRDEALRAADIAKEEAAAAADAAAAGADGPTAAPGSDALQGGDSKEGAVGGAPWDRELDVPPETGPLGLRLAPGSGVVLAVEPGSWAAGQRVEAGDEVVAAGGMRLEGLDRVQLRLALSRRPLRLVLRPRRFAQHKQPELRLEWEEGPADRATAEADRAAARAAAAQREAELQEGRRRRGRGFWDEQAERRRALERCMGRTSTPSSSSAAAPPLAVGEDEARGGGGLVPATAASAAVPGDSGGAGVPEASPEATWDGPVPPREYPEAGGAAVRAALWASLACLQLQFLRGDAGVPVPSWRRPATWRELGRAGLVLPTASSRRGYGACRRLTSATYLGERAGGELPQDVLVAITGFVHGVEAAGIDAGVFVDAPPPELGEQARAHLRRAGLAARGLGAEMVVVAGGSTLPWEAFFDELGVRPLSPCSPGQRVAGTVLTADLGCRLSAGAWWRKAAEHKVGLAYLRRRLELADRLELGWLRSLRTPRGVDVSQHFLRGPYLRYGGHFLPYLDLHEAAEPVLACLRRLGVATETSGRGLRECLRVLEQGGACRDAAVYADLFAALQALPAAEQERACRRDSLEPGAGELTHVFVPRSGFLPLEQCVWADAGQKVLRWLAGLTLLQPVYGRFGDACREWLLGPYCKVPRSLAVLEHGRFLGALRRLVGQADAASRIPVQDRHCRLEGLDAPTADELLRQLQPTAVQAYRHLARCCAAWADDEPRQRARGSVLVAFQQEPLIVFTDATWPRPKRLRSSEAYWDVAPDLVGSRAEKLALKHRYAGEEDLEQLRGFFVEVVGVAVTLEREELEARLRVPFAEGPQEPTSWDEGLGLEDFEEVATVALGGLLSGDPGPDSAADEEGEEEGLVQPGGARGLVVAAGGEEERDAMEREDIPDAQHLPLAPAATASAAAGDSDSDAGAAAGQGPAPAASGGVPAAAGAPTSASSASAATEAEAPIGRGGDGGQQERRGGGDVAVLAGPEGQTLDGAAAAGPVAGVEPPQSASLGRADAGLDETTSLSGSEEGRATEVPPPPASCGQPDPDGLYRTLGVSPDADAEAIGRAFRRLALRCHPDKNGGDEEATELFRRAAAAYEVLSDPAKRRLYDRGGLDALRQADAAIPRQGAAEMPLGRAILIFRQVLEGGEAPMASDEGRGDAGEVGGAASSLAAAAAAAAPGADEAPPPCPAAAGQRSAAPADIAAPAPGGGASEGVASLEAYDRLMERLFAAEEAVESWSSEVEGLRRELRDAERARDHYARLLRHMFGQEGA